MKPTKGRKPVDKNSRTKLATVKDLWLLTTAAQILDGKYGIAARERLLEHIILYQRYSRLKGQGFNVRLPSPRLGRPQLLVVEKKTEVAAEKKSRQ